MSARAALGLIVMLMPIARGENRPDPSGQAQPAVLKNLSLEELSQIEVTTPSKEPVKAFRTPVAIYVITSEDIRRSGATTIPAALRLAPGVEVARIDGSKWALGIRGFGNRLARSVLVLIDGRSVYTPLFAGTYWEVQDTLLEDIDRIEVIRGPGGTIWGPNAVNGVINIITKSTKDTQGTFASAGGGNEEQGLAGFRYGGGNANGLTYRLYAKAYTRAPEYHYNHDNFDDWRGAQGGFRIDWGRGDRDTFTVQGDVYKQEDGERVSISSYLPPSQGSFDGNADVSGGNLLARWNRKLSDDNSVQVQAYYDRTNRYEPEFGERRDTFDVDLILRTKFKPRHQLIYGVGARFSDGRFLEVSSGTVFSPANRLDYMLSGFFEDDITIVNNKLLFTVGTKLLRTNYTNVEAEPSIRLLWTPTDRHSFWASFTRAIRTPSRIERDVYVSAYLGTAGGSAGGTPLFLRLNANPGFGPEQLNGYEVGYRTLISKNVFIDIAGFWNHYHGLLSQDLENPGAPETTLPFPESATPPFHIVTTAQFGNGLYGFTTGGEIAPEWRPTSFWRLRASWSFLNMNLSKVLGPALGGLPPSITGSSPRHQVDAQSSLDIGKKLQMDLVYRYVSALPFQGAPAYSTGDARLAWRLSPHVEFSVVGRNLFQPHHVEYASDPGGPVAVRRSAFASLAWR